MEKQRKSRARKETPPPDRLVGERAARAADGLTAKYNDLCDKYHAITERFEDLSRQKTAVFQLGWWALRTSASGLALVRGGAIQLSNNRWYELDRGQDGSRAWEGIAVDGQTPAVHSSLRDLTLHEAAEAVVHSPPYSTLRRFARRGVDQVIEARTEIVSPEQQVVAFLVHDVTEQAHAEAELRKAQDALLHRDRLQTIGEVASGVAHDLNNALNVMHLRLELMRSAAAKGHVEAEHLDALARIVDDAAVRVARMHDLAGRGRVDFQPVDLAQVISEAVALARTNLECSPTADGPRFHLVTRTGGVHSVLANPAELKHVFVNLLLNARDAMSEGGTICIECRREQDYTTVSVADEGTGIPPDNLERIFESFFTTKGNRGTGLGLAMARGAMSRIGGSIKARNLSPNGAEFLLRFPLRPSTEEPAPAAASRARAAIRGTLRVLLVDDDADCLEVTRLVLDLEGLAVDAARSGAEALTLLRDKAYDMLLCDVGMPEMSGWEVAAQARTGRPGLSIYMITGWGTEFASDSHRDTVDGVLGKPIDLGELREALDCVAARGQRGGERHCGVRQRFSERPPPAD